MATVQTLNDKDGNTFYPVTKTEAVYNSDGTKTLDYILDHTISASTDPADANKVFKGNASLGLVGFNNMDFSTFRGGAYFVSGTNITARSEFSFIQSNASPFFHIDNQTGLSCDVAGTYFVMFQGGLTSGSGLRMCKNGEEVSFAITAGNNLSFTMCRMLYISQGDRISLEAGDSGSTMYGYSWLYVFRVG